ncbi:MAG: archaemetzincin family Zn-dependent metalloprotease [Blastocatellia bacterium]
MAEIHIVAVGRVDWDVLDYLTVTLPDDLGVQCAVSLHRIDPALTYNATRLQYHSTQILARLLDLPVGAGDKTLGVCDVDLFIPILTFVFGEAQLNNRAALISVHRLRQSFYGLPADERLFYERCEKEAVHELGHAFGLVHCHRYECVMHFSNSIEQVDLKRSGFCGACSGRLAASMGNVR